MSFSKSKIFLIFCLAFIFGVFLGRFINYQLMAVLAMIFIMAGTIGYSNKRVFIFSIAGIFLALGAWRFVADVRQNDIAPFYGKNIFLTAQIVDEPDVRSDKTYLTLGNLETEGQKIKSRLLVSVGRFPEYEYGTKLALKAKIIEPKGADAAGEFSYKNYLSRFGVDAVAYNPKISEVESGFGNPVKYALLKLKYAFVQKLEMLLPEPQNSFLAGLLVGLRKTIPQDLSDALAITGTTHVIAISGFNITIIATAVNGFLLRFFRRKISFFVAVLAIAFFVILAGASSSAVRAGIMGGLAMLSLRLGRINSITNALVFAAVAMLLVNPLVLHFDAGFQLSFLALLGLVYLAPIIEPAFLAVPKFLRIYLVPTIAAYIFTLPFLLYTFGRLSLVAILVNVLVLPMIPIAMLAGFLAGILGLIFPLAAIPAVWATWAALSYVLFIVKSAAAIPFAFFAFSVPAWFMILCYFFLFGFLVHKNYDLKSSIFNLKSLLWKPQPKISSNI